MLTMNTDYEIRYIRIYHVLPCSECGEQMYWVVTPKEISKYLFWFRLLGQLYLDILQYQEPASMAQLDAMFDWRSGGCRFNPHRVRQHSFVEIDHENIFYGHSLPSTESRRGFVSSGERMCTILVNRLED